ncbi:hypothetical protein O181_116258 [Austropuccinia psidii MF-1]|uniref:Uncharacterized protein n=1 Tax=Austropuccinia psidii MF-1 TaxID=1389203 RepID=A0A9Q3PWC7_9BASI|nr:hypothetical protein [Austropuccinia psidii MF-1]
MDEVILLYWYWRYRRRRRRAPRKHWGRPFITQREAQGAYSNLVCEMRDNDVEKFINFHRMTPQQFDYLLEKVRPRIQKQNVSRDSITPEVRLSLTLRYLASGDSMVSLHYLYRVGKATISHIIPETCNALWDVLHMEVLPLPSPEQWKRIAEDFENRWNFPNCRDGRYRYRYFEISILADRYIGFLVLIF